MMDFRGPVTTDFDNVRSLNRAFLALLRQDASARRCLVGLPPDLAGRLSSLSPNQAERLAAAPFLLLSFRERDEDFWQLRFAEGADGDLFAVHEPPSDRLVRLISAGLGFIWQLARQSPYAARLICGASLHWCEELTERPIFQVLEIAGRGPEVLALRCGSDTGLWMKLLAGGVSGELLVRRAAHISALHAVLTRDCVPDRRKWAAAACAAKTPALKVAERTDR